MGEGRPQAAVADDAAGGAAAARAGPLRVLRRLAGGHHRRGRRRRPAAGPADGAAPQPDRVRQRGPRPAGAGDRRPRPAAPRRPGARLRQLRQQRRHAADVDGAARALPVGGRENQPTGRRRPRPPPVGDHLRRLAAPAAGRPGRPRPAVRQPRRRGGAALLPARCRVRGDRPAATTAVPRTPAARPRRRGRPTSLWRSASAFRPGTIASRRRSSRGWRRPRG